MVQEARDRFGPPDTLIHLIGGFGMGSIDAEDAPQLWLRMLDLNLHTSFQAFRAMLPPLRERGGGWIVGMGSRVSSAPPAQMAAYAASKAALVALAQSMSEELRHENIHINLIVASTVDTPANRAAMGEKAAAKWVKPEEIAEATLFLCSHRASAVYGATLEVFAKA
jgi:NAD(P)-dependent dehydrogenase (short-subunit alcohol dehydrogenase family)